MRKEQQEIAISIRPGHAKNILTGKKKIEIRTKFPKGARYKIYIYVTKSDPYLFTYEDYDGAITLDTSRFFPEYFENVLNGKIVASFIADKVEEIKLEEYDDYNFSHYSSMNFETKTLNEDELCKKSCLTADELAEYLGMYKEKDVYGYAIHITNLKIFKDPKELSEFGIKKAPQSWMYVKEKK